MNVFIPHYVSNILLVFRCLTYIKNVFDLQEDDNDLSR